MKLCMYIYIYGECINVHMVVANNVGYGGSRPGTQRSKRHKPSALGPVREDLDGGGSDLCRGVP